VTVESSVISTADIFGKALAVNYSNVHESAVVHAMTADVSFNDNTDAAGISIALVQHKSLPYSGMDTELQSSFES
jgi:hypothetical protein